MNTLETLHTQYIRFANRSLETVKVVSEIGHEKTLWIYNFEGVHFRVFEAELDAWKLIDNHGDRSIRDFDTEADLDRFLITLEI
jgi:hypothetical protein